jgi:hypothetical protein
MLVAVLSVKGSPGVTTFSIALAARWPSPVRPLLVEADPSGGDLAMRFALTSTPGLLSLAAAARRSDDPALVGQHAQLLPGGAIQVVAAPPDTDRSRAALRALTPDPGNGAGIVRAAANAPETVIIADCGRIDDASPTMPLVRAADAMVLLTGARADALAHLARRLRTVAGWTPHPVMLLVGDGYSPNDVARELGVPPLGRVPDDPPGAAALCGRPNTFRWRRAGSGQSALGQVAHKVANVLVARQAPAPAPTRQSAPATQPSAPDPVLQPVPGVPATAVSAGGLRLTPPIAPANVNSGRSWGGHAS